MINGHNNHVNMLNDTAENRHFVAMLRRAILRHDRYARQWIQQAVQKQLLEYLHHHPFYQELGRIDSDESYVAQTFERFWLRVDQQKHWLNTRSQVLRYLQAALNGVILESLRPSVPQQEMPVPAQTSPHSPALWNIIQQVLPDERERRVAYLLYHCGLKPAEIVRTCPHEFNDVQEIHSVRYAVIEKMRPFL